MPAMNVSLGKIKVKMSSVFKYMNVKLNVDVEYVYDIRYRAVMFLLWLASRIGDFDVQVGTHNAETQQQRAIADRDNQD